MAFAVFEQVKSSSEGEISGDVSSLGILTRYDFVQRTESKDTWELAEKDFADFKFKNPSLIYVEIKNVDDVKKIPFIYR